VGKVGVVAFLAVMSLFAIEPTLMKSSSLIMNVFVTIISFYNYYKSGYFKPKLFLPLIILSIPMAFLGASLEIDTEVYRKILGACLLITAVSFFFSFNKPEEGSVVKMPLPLGILTGGAIGFLSGLVGIGGGVLLSPVMLTFRWGTFKQVSTITSLFILVNSVAAIGGIINSGFQMPTDIFLWIGVAMVGGLLGSHWGSRKAPVKVLKNLLAFLLLVVSVRLLLQ
jgi:uncharacterized membrane protein YfcA